MKTLTDVMAERGSWNVRIDTSKGSSKEILTPEYGRVYPLYHSIYRAPVLGVFVGMSLVRNKPRYDFLVARNTKRLERYSSHECELYSSTIGSKEKDKPVVGVLVRKGEAVPDREKKQALEILKRVGLVE